MKQFIYILCTKYPALNSKDNVNDHVILKTYRHYTKKCVMLPRCLMRGRYIKK